MKIIILQNIFKFEKTKSINTSEYQIKTITSTKTYTVRHSVLRTGKPIETCIFDGDNLETTIHLGLFIEYKLVGICSFFKNSNPNISEANQYQLRGMAILKPFQGKGLGNVILKQGENLLKEKKVKTLWCNAREVAINFYKKNNYQVTGNAFNIKNIGIHYTMLKTL
ncbi:GNAT family N-acetyltransferase [uncultured Algibacter sp.]|uniref:GNAT family N-acetyltransferase n=1 Tax=uncultured Algibacter sp. TaxID=298659 RepID=UPI00262A1BE8|nr:GNAT family N-acetyltransferase [uncultured Algibacter sp.]